MPVHLTRKIMIDIDNLSLWTKTTQLQQASFLLFLILLFSFPISSYIRYFSLLALDYFNAI